MIKRLLRLFKAYRDLEKTAERSEAYAVSLGRYIEALEGRDTERLARIEELETKCRDARAVLHEALETAADLRGRLISPCPNYKEKEGL
jgi:hypothetical protein